jgi:hypothetical protein
MPEAHNDSRAVVGRETHGNERIVYLGHNNIVVPEMMQYLNTVKRFKRPGNLFRRCAD